MINEELLFNVLYMPHISEKTSILIKNNHTIVLKVNKNANKLLIKSAVEKLFNIKVNKVHTILVKGKKKKINTKKKDNKIGVRKDFKKAYILLKDNQNIDFINKLGEFS